MKLVYKDVKKYFEEKGVTDQRAKRYSDFFSKIDTLVHSDSAIYFHSYNIFLDENILRIYLIYNEKILRGVLKEDDSIVLTGYKLKDLIELEYKESLYETNNSQLMLKFPNNGIVALASGNTGNDGIDRSCKENINSIYCFLFRNYG